MSPFFLETDYFVSINSGANYYIHIYNLGTRVHACTVKQLHGGFWSDAHSCIANMQFRLLPSVPYQLNIANFLWGKPL